MRIAALYSLLLLLGGAAANLAPVSDSGLLASGIESRMVHDATLAGTAALVRRTNDGGDTVVNTKISAVGKGEIGGAQYVVLGAIPNGDGVKIAGDGLGADTNGNITAALPSLGFTGAANSVIRVPGENGVTVVVVGLGKQDGDIPHEKLRQAAGTALRSLVGVDKVAVLLPAETEEGLNAVTEGSALGAYTFSKYKTTGATQSAKEVVVASGLQNAADVVSRADVVTKHVKAARRLVSTPPNVLYPETFVDAVNEAVQGLDGVTVEVWDEQLLAAEGLNLILGVGRGSARPPRLVKVAYAANNANGHVALVGKGITFDSGGLSLKPSASMTTMKSDMSGAAAVLHAALAAAELKVPTSVTAWLCLAENMPDGGAQRVDDILTAYNGLTVEITNTDAEGRLVMADGLAKAVEEKPDLVYDIATLTGAQVTALGNRVAGLMGDDRAIEALNKAAAASGEGFWAMPFPEEMFADMVSPVADYRNTGASDGGMLKGGIFLKPFAEGAPWGHLDIAGPAFNSAPAWGYTPIQGTGFGVRTLLKVAEQFGQ